jgi:predicted transcriptional regulator
LSALLLSCLVLISPDVSAGPTYVHGQIEDTHWTVEDSPVIIIEDATLGVGQVLEIDPGVEVLFNEGAHLYIEGHLFADASEGEGIVFTSNATVKHAGDWGSVILLSPENVIRNARIEFAHRGLLLLEQAFVSLENVHFNNNQFAGIYSMNSAMEMKSSMVEETGEWGIYLENSEAFIESSFVTWNGISVFANSSSAVLVNSTVSGTFRDIVVMEDSHIRLVNSTFDEGKIAFEDEVSSVIVQWFVSVEVRDAFSTHVPAAKVAFSSELGGNTTLWTGEYGLVKNAVITEAELMQFETVNHNPYVIIARKGEQEAETLRTIVGNAWVEMFFSADLSGPTANAGENIDVDEDETASMTASGSADNDPDFLELGDFIWEFDDQGTSVRLEGLTVQYVFDTPGTYWITLTASDSGGNSDKDTVKIVVRDTTSPVADAGGFREANVGESILFDAGNCSDNDPGFWDTASFVWVIELGDESVELPGRTVTYAFESAGNYTVTLHAEDDDGNADSDAIHVAIKAPAQELPLVIPLGLGLIAAAFVGGLLNTEVGKFGLFKFLLIPLYVKLKRKDILDHFLRGQIYGYIKVHPGEHYTSIKNNLQLNNGTLTYHLDVLEREGLIISKPKGSRKIFYPVGMKVPDNGLHAIQEDILERVNESPGMSISDLARLMGISRQLTNYHIKKLVEGGRIDIERKGVKAKCFPSDGQRPLS